MNLFVYEELLGRSRYRPKTGISKELLCEYCGNYVYSIRCDSCGAPQRHRHLAHLQGANFDSRGFGSGYGQ